MTRDRRSAPHRPPDFVWQALDAQPPGSGTVPGPGPGREGADTPAAAAESDFEGDEPTRDARREPGTRRATGRALIAAAVLVPLAGASYAALALSTRHDDTAVVTAGAAQAPDLDAPAGPAAGPSGSGTGSDTGAGSGPTVGRGSGSNPGASPSRVAGRSNTSQPSPPPSASESATTTAGSPNVPSQVATPGRTTVPSAPATAKSTVAGKPTPTPTPTKASRPRCSAAWNPNTSYTPGQVVSYQGQNYTATYYSTDAAPNAAISWDVWTSDGTCS